jgi:hypothetical protein
MFEGHIRRRRGEICGWGCGLNEREQDEMMYWVLSTVDKLR